MDADACNTYRQGRSAFLTAAGNAGLDSITRVHPGQSGPDERPLFLDTVWMGRRDARKALLVIAGTHGIDGAFGSCVLTGLLRDPAFKAPPDAKIVLLHALNPYGYAFGRVTDEANIAVDHNFCDFTDLPANPAYLALAGCFDGRFSAPPDEDPQTVLDVLARGQYLRADGLAYGGAAPCWSQRMMIDVLNEELRQADRLIVLDLHTGAGARGMACLSAPADAGARAAAEPVWGRVQPLAGHNGAVVSALAAWCGAAAAQICIGTLRPAEMLALLCREHWLWRLGRQDHPQAAEIAAAMREAFFPSDDVWRRRARASVHSALAAALVALAQ